MQRLNQQFEDKIEELRQKGKDEAELQELVKGAMAMKDASGIYLSWANHYIARLQSDGRKGAGRRGIDHYRKISFLTDFSRPFLFPSENRPLDICAKMDSVV
ncbi:MAG: hypothetical protein MPW15_24635 [Candidatus Manganitrophus sp.]|nr:hypothetical protein [Candidatus Manganitrophus sp.]